MAIHNFLSNLAYLWILVMVCSVVVAGCAAPEKPTAIEVDSMSDLKFQAIPLVPDVDVEVMTPVIDKQRISVIVKLDFAPLVMYQGGIEGLPSTSAEVTDDVFDVNSEASQAYIRYANQQIDLFAQVLRAEIPTAQIVQRYVVTYGGVSIVLPPEHIKQLQVLPGVVAVTPDEIAFPDDGEQQ